MIKDILIATQIYFLAFVIGIIMAGIIRGMNGFIKNFSHKKKEDTVI